MSKQEYIEYRVSDLMYYNEYLEYYEALTIAEREYDELL